MYAGFGHDVKVHCMANRTYQFWAYVNGFERDFFQGHGRLQGFLPGSLEFAVDGNVGVLVETGVTFHARFGLGAAFDDLEIMVEETYSPFDGCEGVVMLEGVCLTLGFFDEFAVGYAGRRPCLGEMVGVELIEVAAPTRDTADNDVFLVMTAFFVRIHDAVVHLDGIDELKVTYSASVGSGNFGVRDLARYEGLQTFFYDRFQMP